MIEFPCISCGLCCKNLNLAPSIYESLDQGNGCCKHLSHLNQCLIYENRPIICNITEAYDTFNFYLPFDEYLMLNISACEKLMIKENRYDLLEKFQVSKSALFISSSTKFNK